jgi:hypothetical protein
MKFAVEIRDENRLVGVATVGRPVARHMDDGLTVEVTRTCTTGAPNANWSAAHPSRRRQHAPNTLGNSHGDS